MAGFLISPLLFLYAFVFVFLMLIAFSNDVFGRWYYSHSIFFNFVSKVFTKILFISCLYILQTRFKL